MSSGSYANADQLAQNCPSTDFEDVLNVLRALPFPRNTQRVTVRPEGEDYVLSCNVGLTTQRYLQQIQNEILCKTLKVETYF